MLICRTLEVLPSPKLFLRISHLGVLCHVWINVGIRTQILVDNLFGIGPFGSILFSGTRWHGSALIICQVFFTGIWMAETSSLKKRGEVYLRYTNRVSPFFPWFPQENKTK